MENSEIQKRIMSLGETLVKELNLDNSVNTTGRWMAHYITEKMEIAKNSSGQKKKEAQKECFEAILKLWNHAPAFPQRLKLFNNFDSIFQTLSRLNPEQEGHFFFEYNEVISDNVNEKVRNWMVMAKEIDEAARIWLKYVFEQATLDATDDLTIEWLGKSIAFQEEDQLSVMLREIYSDVTNIWAEEKKEKSRKLDILNSRVKKLEAFAELNQVLLEEYKSEREKYEQSRRGI